jgi:signal transduction histidine kinase
MNASSQPPRIEIAAVACVHCVDERARTAQFHDELLAIIGHDLRAPLAAILLSTEMLAMANREPSASAAVTRIASFTKRMNRMVGQLTDLTRARLGGGIPLSVQKLRLGAIVSAAIQTVAHTFPQSRFELVAVDEVLGLWDGDRLTQVLEAVLANAVRHGSDHGSILISVLSSPGETTVAIQNELRDEPLSDAVLATWFTAYRRGRDHDHAGPGLGLDLYIAREIIHAHHGEITAESSAVGTTIRIILPAAHEPARG